MSSAMSSAMSSVLSVVTKLSRALLLSCVLLGGVSDVHAQPYFYRADDVRGSQFFSDLSFLLGMQVRDQGSGLARRRLVGEFRGETRKAFLDALARQARFAWATHKNTLTLASTVSLQTQTYRFASQEEADSFWKRLQREGIAAGPLIVTSLSTPSNNERPRNRDRGQAKRTQAEQKTELAYDVQAIQAFHESAQTVYAELAGFDHNRVLSPSNSVLYPIAGERFALMIFRLQYAWAADTSVGDVKSAKVLPGVANFMEKIVAARYGTSAPRRVAAPRGDLENLVSGSLQKIKELGIFPAPANPATAPSSDATAAAQTSGQPLSVSKGASPLIFADPRQNAVVIYDDRSRYNDYRRLIAELDSRTRLVKIEAAIIDISKSRVNDLGIQWQGSYDGHQGQFGSLAQGAAQGALGFATQGWSLSNNAIISNVNGLIARINLLESQGKGRVVSRPSILTLDNIEASLTSNQKFFVKVEAFQDSSLYPVEVGTTLRVTPHIIREGNKTRIKLLVVIEDGSIDQSASAAVGGLPRITSNTITTQAEILETQALVIGGHIRSEVESRWQRIPLLGYIPILGLPFRHKTKKRQEFVRLYIIRPRLTLPADDMQGAEALAEDENLFAYPKMLQKERDKAERLARKRKRKQEKKEKKARAKAERQRRKQHKQQQPAPTPTPTPTQSEQLAPTPTPTQGEQPAPTPTQSEQP